MRELEGDGRKRKREVSLNLESTLVIGPVGVFCVFLAKDARFTFRFVLRQGTASVKGEGSGVPYSLVLQNDPSLHPFKVVQESSSTRRRTLVKKICTEHDVKWAESDQ